MTAASINVAVTTPGWFLHSGAGNDALTVTAGTNVLDGGEGSNFLTGGTGTDTFFVDARNATADIWSTVNHFHAGDAVTIYGVDPNTDGFAWANGQGAAGYTGLTLHVTDPGKPTASLTVAGYTATDLQNGRLSVSYGHDQSAGANYLYIHANG
jgi:Ca2+-binding RTX toxin-like protein